MFFYTLIVFNVIKLDLLIDSKKKSYRSYENEIELIPLTIMDVNGKINALKNIYKITNSAKNESTDESKIQ